jgi:UDPglucose 6-dehydrogenase
VAFSNFAQQHGVEARLAAATVRVNQDQLEFLVQLTHSLLGDRRRLGVLGLAYKPGTSVVEQSPGLALLESLRDSNLDLKAFDPVARPLVSGVHLCPSAEDCIRHSDVVIVATPWTEFSQLPATLFENKIVLDCWDCLEQAAQARDCDYRKLGEPSCLAPRVETASSHTRIP